MCNSPSSCFVASNNGKLSLYQAIVDASGLLTQLRSKWVNSRHSSSRLFFIKIFLKFYNFSSLESTSSKPANNNNNDRIYLNKTFKVVSTQSTAKPGCILYIDNIMDSEHVI